MLAQTFSLWRVWFSDARMTGTGVVVVTYNSEEVIGACLDSCASLPMVVVDNASNDKTIEQVKQRRHVLLLTNTTNRGFATAANQGVAALDTDFLLLLNPDVQLQGAITPMLAACSLPGVGLATGRLVDDSGSVQTGFNVRSFPEPLTLVFEVLGFNRVFPWNRINRRYRCSGFNPALPADVDQPAGAFLMFRRDVWKRLNGFDSQFHPLWFEDVDFCKRAREAGFKIRYVPDVAAVHQGGHSVSKLTTCSRELYWYVSLLRYASKHFQPYAFRGVSAAVVLGSFIRAVVATVRLRSSKPVSIFARVMRLAMYSMISGRVQEPGGSPGYSKAVG